ncbi:hypothetical protein PsYK624_004040 [Phanerochaete sordida]|uniref:Uncharacterized protein n=1 Tax=Phanerochaete sordida TaxID=48140 RepID=A0A9P3L7U1_9APHY|nr:hypothetical protein PsYK624_004040 [Phanerochaete sordida]
MHNTQTNDSHPSLANAPTAAAAPNTPVPAARFSPTSPSAPFECANWQPSAQDCALAARAADHASGAAPCCARTLLWPPTYAWSSAGPTVGFGSAGGVESAALALEDALDDTLDDDALDDALDAPLAVLDVEDTPDDALGDTLSVLLAVLESIDAADGALDALLAVLESSIGAADEDDDAAELVTDRVAFDAIEDDDSADDDADDTELAAELAAELAEGDAETSLLVVERPADEEAAEPLEELAPETVALLAALANELVETTEDTLAMLEEDDTADTDVRKLEEAATELAESDVVALLAACETELPDALAGTDVVDALEAEVVADDEAAAVDCTFDATVED